MSWPVVPLDKLASKIDYGLSVSAVERNDGPRFLRITDLQDDRVDWNSVPSCECSDKELQQNLLSKGDIVFARTGATTGKSYLLEDMPRETLFASYLIRVRPNEKVDPKYLSFFFRSPRYWQQISVMANGAAQPGVNSTKLKELEVPLPPLAEQKRIAAILDKADNLRRKRQQAIKLADEFLLSMFLSTGCQPIVTKIPSSQSSNKGWQWVKLSEVARLESGHTPSRKIDEYWGGDIKWLSLKDIKGLKGIYIDDTVDNPTELGIANSSARLLPKGTVALCRTASVGNCVILGDEMATSQDFVDWVCGDKILPEFLYTVIKCSKKEFDKLKQGSTHKSIYMPTVKDFCVYLPPSDVQKKITSVMKWRADYTNTLSSNLLQCDNLFNSLSQKAFSGQL